MKLTNIFQNLLLPILILLQCCILWKLNYLFIDAGNAIFRKNETPAHGDHIFQKIFINFVTTSHGLLFRLFWLLFWKYSSSIHLHVGSLTKMPESMKLAITTRANFDESSNSWNICPSFSNPYENMPFNENTDGMLFEFSKQNQFANEHECFPEMSLEYL